MHPLRETIKISGKRERERGARRPPWWPLPRAHLQFVIRHTQRHRACETPISTFFPTLSVSKHLRFIRIAFERHILSLPSSFSRPPLFPLLWSPVLPLFLSFFIPRLPLLSSSSSLSLPFVLDSPSSSSSRLARIRGTRGKFRKGESEERTKGRTSTHTATLFACITAIYSRGGRDPFTRVRASEKRFENLHEGGTDGGEEGAASTRGESENLRAIAIRARVHCAKFRRKREREREIDNAIENELNAYQRSNFIFPSSGISITHVY